MAFEKLESLINDITDRRIIPAISVAVGRNGNIVYKKAFGRIFETGEAIDITTQFDIASLTKIYTGSCFMKLIEQGFFYLDQPIAEIFPRMGELKPIEKDWNTIGYCDGSKVTWRHVLTHTTGMGWTREKTRPSLPGIDRSLDVIYDLPFAYRPGEHVVYSDIPIILMGKAMELVTKTTLDHLVQDLILNPLSLKNTGYKIIDLKDSSAGRGEYIRIPPTEYDDIYRKKRVWGQVHDENAWTMGGVAAHAGIFSTAEDLCRFMTAFAGWRREGGLLSKKTALEMSSLQVEEEGDRRGLIWQLSGSTPESYTSKLSQCAYGHAGFTGCFAWNDPIKGLSIVLLSNDVYNGRENRKLAAFRKEIMNYMIDL